MLPVEMVSFCFMLYILATMTKIGNSLNVDTGIFKDLTGECWGEGKIEEKLVFNENPVSYVKLLPVGGHNRKHFTNCTINVSTEENPAGGVSAISLAILHLQFSGQAGGETVSVVTAGNDSARSTAVGAAASYDQPGIVVPVTN